MGDSYIIFAERETTVNINCNFIVLFHSISCLDCRSNVVGIFAYQLHL